jgi:hypothetical protein
MVGRSSIGRSFLIERLGSPPLPVEFVKHRTTLVKIRRRASKRGRWHPPSTNNGVFPKFVHREKPDYHCALESVCLRPLKRSTVDALCRGEGAERASTKVSTEVHGLPRNPRPTLPRVPVRRFETWSLANLKVATILVTTFKCSWRNCAFFF